MIFAFFQRAIRRASLFINEETRHYSTFSVNDRPMTAEEIAAFDKAFQHFDAGMNMMHAGFEELRKGFK